MGDGRDTDHVEHERTYAVPDGAAVPFLPGLDGPPVVAEVRRVALRAEYHDTEGLDLLRRGITLRRRTGGDDEGWHLKLPVGPHRRREVHEPLGEQGAGVPAPLLDRVRALARDRPLRPVATVATDREETLLVDAGGEALAVLCDDRVAAGSPLANQGAAVWREWELELAPGRDASDLDALEDALLAAGAHRSDQPSKLARALGRPVTAGAGAEPDLRTAGGVLHARVVEQRAELLRRDADVRAGHDRGVHGMRVAARRLRSTLRTARPLLEPGVADHVRAELRLLGRVLGPARDARVLEVRLRAALEAEPAELVLGPVAARLVTELHRDRDRAAVRVHDALRSDRYWRLLDDLDALVDEPPLSALAAERAGRVLPDLVAREARRVRRAARVVDGTDGPDRDAALHEVRKRARRLRYAAELAATAGPASGRRTRRLVRRAEAVQEALGEHQDAVVAQGALRRLGVAAHLAGENGFTFGLLLGTERLRAVQARARAHAAVDRLPGPARVARWVRP
jgi:CHAD domain-containing protein